MVRTRFYITFTAAFVLLIAACTKDYTCDCTIEEANNKTESTSFALEGFSNNDAVDECDSKERFTADSVKINCELN